MSEFFSEFLFKPMYGIHVQCALYTVQTAVCIVQIRKNCALLFDKKLTHCPLLTVCIRKLLIETHKINAAVSRCGGSAKVTTQGMTIDDTNHIGKGFCFFEKKITCSVASQMATKSISQENSKWKFPMPFCLTN